jgi:hypothetical protein
MLPVILLLLYTCYSVGAAPTCPACSCFGRYSRSLFEKRRSHFERNSAHFGRCVGMCVGMCSAAKQEGVQEGRRFYSERYSAHSGRGFRSVIRRFLHDASTPDGVRKVPKLYLVCFACEESSSLIRVFFARNIGLLPSFLFFASPTRH